MMASSSVAPTRFHQPESSAPPGAAYGLDASRGPPNAWPWPPGGGPLGGGAEPGIGAPAGGPLGGGPAPGGGGPPAEPEGGTFVAPGSLGGGALPDDAGGGSGSP